MTATRIYTAYALLVLTCTGVAAATGAWWVLGLPALPWVVGVAVADYRPLFWLMLIMIPLGTEIVLPGGIGTDLPTEPLAVGLTGLLLLHAARYWPSYRADVFAHPIALLLYAHLAWIAVTTLSSTTPVISLKFLLSKLWYLGAFFWLPLLLLDRPARVRTFAHCVCWPLLFVAVQTLVRHAAYDFSFADQFRTMHPFMRNHVAYAGCLATFAPWVGYLMWSRHRRGRSLLGYALLVVPLWLAAVYFSYTRAAYVALILAGGAYFLIRWKLLRPALVVGLLAAVGLTTYLLQDNRYLDYAPNYETTVSHKEFDGLIEATYKLEDVSTMERFYRWVAGGNMVPYRPVVGFGPGSFVEQYKAYTTDNFRTYVSENPERSGIHNYYLMTLVEQGYPGLLLLLFFMLGTVWIGQRLYHEQSDPAARAAIMAALLSLLIVEAFCIINDLLETDKVGSLFFINVAVLITAGRYRGATSGSTAQQQENDGNARHAPQQAQQ